MFPCEHNDIYKMNVVFRYIGMMEMSRRNRPVLKKQNTFHIVGKISNVQAPECPHKRVDIGPVYDVTCMLPPLTLYYHMVSSRVGYA